MTEVVRSLAELDLSAFVRERDMVLWGQACAEPVGLTGLLMEQRASIGPFRVMLGVQCAGTVRPEHTDLIAATSYCGTGDNRALARAGVLDILPAHYSSFPDLFSQGPLAADVVMLLLPPPDQNGRFSLGLASEYLPAALDHARVVIAEVSDRVPVTRSRRMLDRADIDVIVHTSTEPPPMPAVEPSEAEEAIAERVAALVPDGSTIQVGLGSLPVAVLRRLHHHRDLGIHSGLVNDGVADLIERGVVTGARKSQARGVAVAGSLMGTERLLTFAHRDRVIELRATNEIHDAQVLAAQSQFVAINSAVQVDLTGQVNSEEVRGSYVGAVGGAGDFLRGAHHSPGGLPIIALPSTAGAASRVVANIDGPVTSPRSDAGIFVTEHGVADLRGQPRSRRAELMLELAAPEHREALEREHRMSQR